MKILHPKTQYLNIPIVLSNSKYLRIDCKNLLIRIIQKHDVHTKSSSENPIKFVIVVCIIVLLLHFNKNDKPSLPKKNLVVAIAI